MPKVKTCGADLAGRDLNTERNTERDDLVVCVLLSDSNGHPVLYKRRDTALPKNGLLD